jgi:hypothetical protein
MYGLAAIEQANGWAMAVTGAGIVLTGLAVLSLFNFIASPPDQHL